MSNSEKIYNFLKEKSREEGQRIILCNPTILSTKLDIAEENVIPAVMDLEDERKVTRHLSGRKGNFHAITLS